MGDDKMYTEELMGRPSNEGIFKKEKYDWSEKIEPHIKIAVVGKKGCGKSSLILAAKEKTIFPHPDEIFVSKQHYLEVDVDGKKEYCMVAEVDDGDDNIDRRNKIYSETDVVVLCFSNYQECESVKKLVKLSNDSTIEDPDEDQLSNDFTIEDLDEDPSLPEYLGKDPLPEKPVVVVKILKKLEKGGRFSYMDFSGYMECHPHGRKGVKDVFQEAIKKAKKHGICEKKVRI